MAGNTHWWDTTIPHLQPASRAAAMDFSGHGESSWSLDRRYDLDLFLSDIEEARKALGFERFILGAHSMGARIALEYAASRPENLLALIAIDFLPEFPEGTTNRFETKKVRRQPSYSSLERPVKNFRLQPAGTLLSTEELHALAHRCLRPDGDGRFTWKFDWGCFTYPYTPIWPTIPRVKVPTLIVRGEHSTVLLRRDFERVTRELAGTQAVEIPRSHHHVPLDTPKELANAMTGFIQSLPRCSARSTSSPL